MSDPKPSYHNNPKEPKLKLPPGACDAHFHVFGPKAKFPYAEKAPYVPADAPKDVLIDRHMFLGIERGVVVQSAAHGFDNSAAADLLADMKGSYVGVALVPVNTEVSALKKLHEQGIITYASFIIGHPGETEESAQNTLNFVRETSPTFYSFETFFYDKKVPIGQKAAEFNLTGNAYS